jgi:hypothetical protein
MGIRTGGAFALQKNNKIISDESRKTITIENPETAINITIEGPSNKFNCSDLLAGAAVELIDSIRVETFNPDDTEKKILTAFCEMLRENFEYPEEMTHKEIMSYYLNNEFK